MKKVKPIYIYSTLIIICVILIYLFSRDKHNKATVSSAATKPGGIANQQAPNDSIHPGMMNPVAQKPSKENVRGSIMQHMEELKKDVGSHPKDNLKMREYAEFLNEAHQNDQAIIYYQKILNRDPQRTDILTSLVFIYFNDKNFDKAEECLIGILSIDKNNVEAMYNLGAVYATQGEKEKAHQIWFGIIKNFPYSPLVQKAKQSIQRL